MKISPQEVEHVAHLARLKLDAVELQQMTEQLDTILAYVAKLEELDTEAVEPTTHASSISNAFRDDTVKPSLGSDEALSNAPQQDGESFIVPRVI